MWCESKYNFLQFPLLVIKIDEIALNECVFHVYVCMYVYLRWIYFRWCSEYKRHRFRCGYGNDPRTTFRWIKLQCSHLEGNYSWIAQCVHCSWYICNSDFYRCNRCKCLIAFFLCKCGVWWWVCVCVFVLTFWFCSFLKSIKMWTLIFSDKINSSTWTMFFTRCSVHFKLSPI